MECKIDNLPDVLLEYILSLIPPYKDLQECKLVCKRWFHATKSVMQHNKAHFQKSVAYGSLLWSALPSIDEMPTIGKRHSHSACVYDNSMYVFGGSTARRTTFNDLWRLDLDTRTWVRLITMGSYPSPKARATMLHYKKNLILFGGWTQPSPYPLHRECKLFNELHVYSIELNKWIVISTLESPPPTSAHSASIHKNNMVVFGGICNGDRSNDVWCLNLDSYCWHKQATSKIGPLPRYGQSQIELGDHHLLVLGGCIDPNFSLNDVWLLKMEGTCWTWKKVNMHNEEWAPTQIWCNQACKVGNYVIVLSIKKSSNMNVMLKKFISQRTAPSRTSDSDNSHERQENESRIDRDVNVNGRHGSFSRASEQNAHSSSHPPNSIKNLAMSNDNVFSMAAFRERLVYNSSNSNRQRQLESLRRMEERIRTQSKAAKRTGDTLSIFVLDITNVLCDECSASWIPLKHNNQSGPDERMLYSLVAGRGELIVFGGIHKEQVILQNFAWAQSVVYNDLHFINPPRYVI